MKSVPEVYHYMVDFIFALLTSIGANSIEIKRNKLMIFEMFVRFDDRIQDLEETIAELYKHR